MADVHNPATRSYNMSQIKGKDTRPEMIVRKYLHARGLRYSLHNRKLPGKPDLVFRKYKTVIFVNGCFWHGHKGCKYFVLPKTRTEWWSDKIEQTKKRDQIAVDELSNLGWNIIVVWECELKSDTKEMTLDTIFRKIVLNERNEKER